MSASHRVSNVVVRHRRNEAHHDLLSQQEANLSRSQLQTTFSQDCRHVTAVLRVLLLIGNVEMNPGPITSPQSPTSPHFYSACATPEWRTTPPNYQLSPSASLPWLRDRRSSSFSLESNISFSDTISSPVTATPRETHAARQNTATMAHDASQNWHMFDPLYNGHNPVTSSSMSVYPTPAPRLINVTSAGTSATYMTLPTSVIASTIPTVTSRSNTTPTPHFNVTSAGYSATYMTLPTSVIASTIPTVTSRSNTTPTPHFNVTSAGTSATHMTLPTSVIASTIPTVTSRSNTTPTPYFNVTSAGTSATYMTLPTSVIASTIPTVTSRSNTTPTPHFNVTSAGTSATYMTLPTSVIASTIPTVTSRSNTTPTPHFNVTSVGYSATYMTLPTSVIASTIPTVTSRSNTTPTPHFNVTSAGTSATYMTLPTSVIASTIPTVTSRSNTTPATSMNAMPSTNEQFSRIAPQYSPDDWRIHPLATRENSHDSYHHRKSSNTMTMSTPVSKSTNIRLNETSSTTTSHAHVYNRMPPQHWSSVVPSMSSQIRLSPVRNPSSAQPDLYQQALRNATRTMQQLSFPSTSFEVLRINPSAGHSSNTQATPSTEMSNDSSMQQMARNGNVTATNPMDNTTSFRVNPFYEHVTELLKLTVLENGSRASNCTNFYCKMQMNLYSHECTSNFNYYYTCLQFKLNNSEVFKVNSKQMVQLRFCRLNTDTTGPYDDFLPSGLQIMLNKENIILPLVEFRQGDYRIPAQPIDLKSHYLKTGETNQHLVVIWRHEPKDGTMILSYENSVRYAVSVSIVKKLEPEEAVTRLNCISSRERTEAKIREHLQTSEVDEVSATTLRISLTCPLSMVRIKTPVRFQSCRHLQCVDALALLRLYEISRGWRCPICNASSSYSELHVDQYFVEVLASPLLPSSCSEIELQENGSWKPYSDPKVRQDLDYRFNISLNDSIVEIPNGDSKSSLDVTPMKCDLNQSVVMTFEKPAPFPRWNTVSWMEKNLKEFLASPLGSASSQDPLQQNEEDLENFSLYLDTSEEALDVSTMNVPENHQQELVPNTTQLSDISSTVSDFAVNMTPPSEKVQESVQSSSNATETTEENILVEPPSYINELSFLGAELMNESSTENVHEVQNENDLAETSTQVVDELSFLGAELMNESSTENVHELPNENDLAETSTQVVVTDEISFLVETMNESSTENVHELSTEIDLTESSTVDINEVSFLGGSLENVHELTNETGLAETSAQNVDTNESSLGVESTENLTNEVTPVQTKQSDVTEKAPQTTKPKTKEVKGTKKKPLNDVPPKKTNRKAKKIVTFVISDDSEEDDPTHKQKTTNASSQGDEPHRPFTRSQARRAGKKN